MAPSKYKVIREAKAIWRRFAPFQRDYPNDDAHHERANSYMFRSRSRIPGLTGRRVFLNIPISHDYLDKHQNPKVKFPTNKIVTSKYNIFTFVPKNFFEQFRRVANLYFLIVAILQLVPIFGVGSPVFVVLPIITVIAITAVKDAVEDYRRQQADKEFNSTTTHILSNWINVNTPANPTSNGFVNFFKKPIVAISNLFSGNKQPSLIEGCSSLHGPEFQPTIWQDVKVGDIIHIAKDEPVPADILILSSDDPDGECYIETKNLDGETNLKTRNAIPETSYIQTPLDCSRVQGYVDTDHPSSNIYVFNGNFTIMESDNDDSRDASIYKNSYTDDVRMSNLPSQTIPFNNKNVLLRGHVLRNTPFVIGVVLFTGNDTKIMLNSGTTPSKRSKIEKTMNKQVGFNAFVLFLLSLCLAIGYGITMANSSQSQRDLFGFSGDSTLWQGFINFWASVILLQNIIPISLYVSIEVVKSFQALFIYSDLNMYYEPTDSPCIPKSWNLSDDLGQVQYLFSDKTGTLTRNVMEFKHCIINGKVYGKVIPGQETDVEKGLLRKQGGEMQERKGTDKATMISEHFHEMKKIFESEYCEANEENITFCDADLYRDIAKDDEQSEEIRQFFLNLALCHTVLIEHNNKADSSSTSLNSNNFVYRAESPDEKALVSAAKDAGFTFMNRSKTTMGVDILGEKYDFELLDVLEFNSTRKRTSVLIKRPAPWNDIVLFIKGADNVIIDRLHEGQDEIVEQTQKQINHFSNQGLRTLCLAYKILDEGECEEWRDRYKDALSSMDNREKLVDQCCEDMETDLTLLGATAIEDKLQEGVPECIESLRAAGIRVWVLTGDKMETAINIGFACSLLNKDMKVYTVTNGNAEQVEENFFHIAQEIRNKEVHDGSDAIVIDGGALKHIVDRRKCLKTLVELAPIFGSVICCRTSPLQKAQVVHMIKKGYKAITLSIGDGANDVSMIQQAHVGVAIAGEEGLQASMASDYTISQFKFLSNLLLAHGQMSYHRISEMILCFFYKNMVWTVSAFWYQFYCLFSANLFFDYSLITLYNLVFTVATVVIMGGQDLPISYENYLKNPQIYKLGIKQRFFNTYIFFTYILDSLYQSLLCYFIYHLVNYSGVDNINGKSSSLYYQSSGTAVAIVIIANLFVGFHCRYWTWIMHFFTWLCIILIFIFLPIYSMIFKENFYYIGIQVMQNANFWLAIPIAVVASLLPRYLNSYIRQTYYPNDLDIVRENQLIKKIQ